MDDKITREIAIGSFWNFMLTLFARLGSIFFVIIIARFLLPDSFGIYTLAVSISLILLVTIDTGINQTLLKYVAEALNQKDKRLATATFRYLYKLKVVITLIVTLSLIILAYPLSQFIFRKSSLFMPLVFSSMYILVNSIGSFYSSYFYIIKKLGHVTIRQIIFEVLRIFGVLGMFLILARNYHIVGVIGVLTISTVISILYLLYHIKKISPFLSEKTNEKIDKKKIIRFSVYFGAIGSMLVIFGYIDIIMIGIFLEAKYVGYYSAALALVTGIWGFLSLSQIVLPIFTELNNDQIQKEFNKIFKYLSLLAVPSIFGIFVLGKYFIIFIYGYEYLPAVSSFYVLSLLIFIIPLLDLIIPIFSAKDKPKLIIKGLVLSTILNILLNFILINIFLKISSVMAITAASIATFISQSFYLVFLLIYLKKELGINSNFNHLIKPLIASSLMVLILFIINLNINDINIFIGALEIFLGIIIYFILFYLMKGFDKEDSLILKDVFNYFLK